MCAASTGGPAGLGPRIIKAREALGWTQTELAHRTGIAVPVLNRYETGARTNPGLDHLRRLADALGVSLDYLAEREDPTDESDFPCPCMAHPGQLDHAGARSAPSQDGTAMRSIPTFVCPVDLSRTLLMAWRRL